MAHILVAGLGALGTGVARYFQQAGHQVSAIRRKEQAPEGIDLYAQDLTGPMVLLPPDQVDLLYIILTPGERSEEGYKKAFIEAPVRLLESLVNQQPLPPVIFVSSTAVFGDQQGDVNENTAPRPERFNGKVLLAAEEIIADKTLATTVRFSGIYGAGRKRILRQVDQIHQGEALPSPKWTNRIHEDDCIGLLTHLGEGWLDGEMQPSLVVGTDQCPVTNLEVLEWVGGKIGKTVSIPDHEVVKKQATGKRLNSNYLQTSGYELQYPSYREGYGEMIGL